MLHYIDQERAILRDNIDLQQKALDLAQVRHNGGVASGLDVSEAATLLDTTQGDYAGLGVQRAQFEHALAVLVGKPPAVFSVPEKTLDLKPPVIPAGLPSDLLERRPDIAAAERTMDSNNALIGVARAAYFPNVALTGSGGLLSASFAQLFTVPSLVWTVAAGATQPIYAGGRLSAGMEQARATYEESVDNYRAAGADGVPGSRGWALRTARPRRAGHRLQQGRAVGPENRGYFHIPVQGRPGGIHRGHHRGNLSARQRARRRSDSRAAAAHDGSTDPGPRRRMGGFEDLHVQHNAGQDSRRDARNRIAAGYAQ